MKFKVGDTVEIIGNEIGHSFGIGEIVEIKEVHEFNYAATDGNEHYYVSDNDIELVKTHTNKNKKYWAGSFLNVGTDKDQDWVDCDKAQGWTFDHSDLAGNYSIAFWLNGHANILGDLTKEQHDDIRFEILDYLDKL